MAAAEVYSPTAAAAAQQQQRGKAASQAWRAVVGWIGFLLQVLLQILRGTPSCAQLLSFVGFRYPLISGPAASEPSPEVAFMPLRSEIPADAAPAPTPAPEPLGRLTVVLDLDETLVSAYESSSLPAIVRTQAVEAGLHCFDMECISSDKDVEGKQKVNHVTVFERPGLHEFLQKTSEFADLILFTAGLEGYARPLVDRIDVHNRFRLRLYRPSTVTTEYREHVKDLSCVSKDFGRIVIVDNNPFSFILQPLNGIPCVPFSAGQHSDDQLMTVIFPLLKHLSLQKDVRPVLHERFHMPEWFQKHGIPQTNQAVSIKRFTRSSITADDPRKAVHGLKVGLALALVSVFYYTRPLYDCVGGAAMWAIMTVVVVFEYTVGGSVYKCFNRVVATASVGVLALGVHWVADRSGELEPVIVTGSLFLLGTYFAFVIALCDSNHLTYICSTTHMARHVDEEDRTAYIHLCSHVCE